MNIRASRLNPAFSLLTLLAFLIGPGCGESPTSELDTTGGDPVSPPGTPDYFPRAAVGDSIVWDYHGGWVTSGASTEYYRGTKTWRITGQRTEQGVHILDVVQVFAGFKYAFPVARDTVWYPALVTAGQISEDSAGTIRITFSEPTGPAGTPALTFPRYLPDPGPFAEYTVGQYVGVRYTLQLRKDVGLIDVRYASGGGSGSFVCYMTRR